MWPVARAEGRYDMVTYDMVMSQPLKCKTLLDAWLTVLAVKHSCQLFRMKIRDKPHPY